MPSYHHQHQLSDVITVQLVRTTLLRYVMRLMPVTVATCQSANLPIMMGTSSQFSRQHTLGSNIGSIDDHHTRI